MKVTVDFYIGSKAGDDPILSYITNTFYPSYNKGDVIDLKRDDVIEREKADNNFEGEYIIHSVRHSYSQRGVIKRGAFDGNSSSNSCGLKIYLKPINDQ